MFESEVSNKLEVEFLVPRVTDKAIHWINHYPTDRVVCFINTCLLDTYLSVDSVIYLDPEI